MTLLSINGTDYTKNIVSPTWAISANEVVTNWTDASNVIHRDVLRTRCAGQFQFKDRNGGADYSALLADLAAARTANNAYTISVYCTNTKETKTIEAFLTWTPPMARIAGGPVLTDAFAVTLEER